MLAAMPHQIPLPVTIDVKPPRNMTAHPTPRQDDEALRVMALLDDLHAQRRHPCRRSFSLPGVVATTGRDRLKLTEAPAYFVEDQPGSTYRFEVT
jgi:hypothetical protein